MIDLCVTELIKNHDPFQPNFGSRRWSRVIAMDHFDGVREVAEAVYENMVSREHFLPEVTRHGADGITLTWTNDDGRMVKIILSPHKFSYQWGKQGLKLPIYTIEKGNDAKAAQMLNLFSSYLNRGIEVVHEKSGDNYSLSSGASLDEDCEPTKGTK